jgi:hypothetical protein
MTPEEKAEELVNRVSECGEDNEMYIETAKKCALIAIDELILSTCVSSRVQSDFINYDRQYWQEVKQEIEKL